MRLLTHFTSRFLRIIGSLRSWSSLTSFSASLESIHIHIIELFTEANDTIPGEEQVNVNAVEAEFEDRNAGGRNWTDVGHLVSQPKHFCT